MADIQIADMLKLPVPEGKYRVVITKLSELQQDMVTDLGVRAGEKWNGQFNRR